MATNLSSEEQPFASVTPMRILAGLYRSTFVDKMQERFRLMLAGAYAVYVTALAEGFDPALRAHLTDILQDIIARTSELTDAFEEELMCCFRAAMEHPESPATFESRNGESGASGRPDFSACLDPDPLIHEFITKTIRGLETRHGSIVLAVTRTYVRLVDQSVEDFRPPWSPASLFSAFAAVLKRIDVPIHEKVKLALYRMYAQEVLRHMGDACLAFRDVLPADLAQLNVPGREGMAWPGGGMPSDGSQGVPCATARNGIADPPFPKLVLAGVEGEDRRAMECHGEDNARRRTGGLGPRAPAIRKLIRAMLMLLAGIGIVGAGWWIGTYFAKARSGKLPIAFGIPVPGVPADEPLPGKLSPESPSPGSAAPEATAKLQPPGETAFSGKPVPMPLSVTAGTSMPTLGAGQGQVAAGLAPQQKREVLRTLKLKNFSWKVVGQGKDEILFDLLIANTGKVPIGGIEVVCSQYSATLDFLETAKTVLAEPVEPGQSKAFKAVPIGFFSKQTERVNCVIADAAPL